MTLAIQELGGSPIETYTINQFKAKRMFVLPWLQRDEFAKYFFGNRMYDISSTLGIQEAMYVASDTAESALTYPGKPTVFVTKIHFEPYDLESLDLTNIETPSLTLGKYNSFAKAIVDYESQTTTIDRADSPEVPSGTYLTYKMVCCSETIPVPSREMFWEDNAALPVSEDLMISQRIPIIEHHLTWHNVISPPWDTISQLQGTVNQSAFLGYPAETLLFDGAESYKIYNSSLQNGAVGYTWQIKYIFREKRVQIGANSFGWNHFHRDAPTGWVKLTNGTGPLYRLANHELLFS